MLDTLGLIVLTAIIIVGISTNLGAMPLRIGWRIGLSTIAGVWVGSVAALSAAGLFLGTNPIGPPMIGAAVTLPLIATAIVAALSPSARAALLAMPMPLLVGPNTWRIGGAFFLLLALEGRLGGPFPRSAGWGDLITGVLALPVAWLALRGHDRLVLAWNAFGALDLVVAVFLGVTSANGSPLQLIHAGAGSQALQALPWSLIPTVLVPMALIMHAVIFAQLWAKSRRGASAGQDSAELA
jgi:hypothetical protein